MNSFLFSDESEKKHALACLEFAKRLGLIDDERYRCTKNVLQAAMNVVGCNQIRFKKRLSTPNEQGKPVKVMEFDNPREEYVKIAAFLKKRLEAGENLEDTAVLFRTNQEADIHTRNRADSTG